MATGEPPIDTPLGLPTLERCEWLSRSATRKVFSCLRDSGHEARAVGGAVRNTLLGLPVKDIDIATTAKPEEILECATRAKLKAVPTGIDHGTVTIIADKTPYEVTTLREDVETFGRRARVAFTDDWEQDARRRDFTINALYCDPSGAIYDPVGGLQDLRRRHVLFIGDAGERIREDYLRILRFFRFTAEFTDGVPDPTGLAYCAELKGGLDRLAGERVTAELMRLVRAPASSQVIAGMQSSGVLDQIFGCTTDVAPFVKLVAIETSMDREPDPIVRLAALAVSKPGDALALRDRLKLSSRDYDRLARMALADPAFDPETPEASARAFIYRHGAQAFYDAALLAWARSRTEPGDASRQHRLELAKRWTAPTFPLQGVDILKLGIEPGPRVGAILSNVEEWWIGEDFPNDPVRLGHRLHQAVTVTKT